jgi:hypothetical protein
LATPGRGGPHMCSSEVSGGPSITLALVLFWCLADLFAVSAPPVLTLCVLYALRNAAPPLRWQIRGRSSNGYGQHTWLRPGGETGRRCMVISRGASTRGLTGVQCGKRRGPQCGVCAPATTKSRGSFPAVRSLGNCLLLHFSSVRLATAYFFLEILL